jgi:hypothetical protein
MTVVQLFARIGIKADAEKAKEVRESIKKIEGQLKTAAVGALAFGASVALAMKGALDSAKAFRQFQAETGASAEELQKWQAVASGANVSTQAIADSVKELAQNREKIKLGGGNMSGFAFLGINPMDDPFAILDQLRAKTEGLPQAMKANLLAQMGVSNEFLQILSLTNGQFAEMRSNAFVIPQSALDALNRTQGALNVLGNAVKWFQALMAERLAPTIDKVVRSFTEWIKANKDGLIAGFLNGTRLLLKFIEAIVTVATWIGRIVTATIGWKNAFNVLLIALAYFNRALLMSPIGIIIGSLLLLIAVLDDLHAAFHVDGDNRQSFFGAIFDKFPALKALFEGTFGFIKDLVDVIKGLFGGDQSAFDNALKKWGIWGTVIKGIRDALQWIVENIGKGLEAAGKAFGPVGDVLSGKKKITDKLSPEEAKNAQNFADGLMDAMTFGLNKMFRDGSPEAKAAVVGASSGGSSSGGVSVMVNNSSEAPITSKVTVKKNTDAKTIQANRSKVQ